MATREAFLSIPARVDALDLILNAHIVAQPEETKERLAEIFKELNKVSPEESDRSTLSSSEFRIKKELVDEMTSPHPSPIYGSLPSCLLEPAR